MLPVLGSLLLNEAHGLYTTLEAGSVYISELTLRFFVGELDKVHFNEWHLWLSTHDETHQTYSQLLLAQ